MTEADKHSERANDTPTDSKEHERTGGPNNCRPSLSSSPTEPPASYDNDVEAQDQAPEIAPAQTTNDRPYSTFTGPQKVAIVFIACIGTCFSAFTVSIYLPALNTISQHLGVSISEVNFTITAYMIFQAVAPTFISAIADARGRRPAYVIGFTIYILANLGLGLNNSYAGLLVLRCIQSSGGSGLVTLAQGTVADVVTSAERGKYIAITSMTSVLAPSVAPITGGLLAQNLGWHSIFWFLLIASVVYFIPLLLFFPETGRTVVGDGSIVPPKWNRCVTDLIRKRHRLAKQSDIETSTTNSQKLPPKPKVNIFGVLTIIADPETSLVLLANALVYSGYIAVTTSLTVQFAHIYHLNATEQGLLFIPLSVASIFAAIFNAKVVDARYKKFAAKAGVPYKKSKQINILKTPMHIERARLGLGVPMLVVSGISIIVYGWLLHARVNIAGPIVMLFVQGLMIVGSFSLANVMVIDLHRKRPATANATGNLTRCLLGAGASAVVNPLIEAIGVGWCMTVAGLLNVLGAAVLGLVVLYGPAMRRKREEKEERLEREKKEQSQAQEKGEDGKLKSLFARRGAVRLACWRRKS